MGSRMSNVSNQAEFWDERYRGEGFAFGTKPNEFLAAQAHLLKPGQRAFVPGDGQGRNGVWLAEQGLIVDSVDVSPLGVAKAKAFAESRGAEVNMQLADLLVWEWPKGRYDAVAALYVHFTDADRTKMHRAMLDALKPQGVLLLEAFRIEQLEFQKVHHSGGPKVADMLYSKAKLEHDFAGADLLLLEELEAELDEGHRHKGRGAIVRAIVKKPNE
jgi:Methyltransferase domain